MNMSNDFSVNFTCDVNNLNDSCQNVATASTLATEDYGKKVLVILVTSALGKGEG